MSVNKVTLIGNLGAAPEVNFMPSGDAAVNLSVATSLRWTGKDGIKQEQTEWHRVTAFGKTAEFAAEYLAKGRTVYVEGRLRTRKWTDSAGIDRFTTEIVANEIQAIGPRPTGEAAPSDDDTPFDM